jgi:hypothetical protein
MENLENVGFLDHKIWKIPMSGIDNQKIIDELQTDRDLWLPNKRYQDPELRKPGIQLDGQCLMGDETRLMFNKCYNTVKETIEKIEEKKVSSGYQRTWFYIAVPELPNTDWHQHLRFQEDYINVYTDYTWIYYVSIPDNCSGDEGKLFFRDTKDHTILHSFFPEYGYIYIFDAALEHLPALSPKSTKERITSAGNVILNFKD